MLNPHNLHCSYSYVKKINIPFPPVRNKGKYSDTTIAKISALYRTFWVTYIYGSDELEDVMLWSDECTWTSYDAKCIATFSKYIHIVSNP